MSEEGEEASKPAPMEALVGVGPLEALHPSEVSACVVKEYG
jgi:hypothetical protein